jgi:flavorubredoxin
MDMNISDAIRYVGVNDTDIDLFESQYVVPNGVSYNSYLILDQKVAVMDTVDLRKTEEWLQNLERELSGRQPDYLVVHHLEPDHAGSIRALTQRYPQMTLVASAKAVSMLPAYFPDCANPTLAVKEGDALELGEHTLTFVMAPMVHWPEVMVSYEKTEKVLFSADGFGKFGAIGAQEDWLCEARRYYFNIVGKYGAQVQSLLKKAAGLDIQTIAPLHGPVLKENLAYYIGKYDLWSRYEPEDEGVLIAYASIHGNTANAAKYLKTVLEKLGCPKVAMADLCRDDQAEAVEDAFRYGKMVAMASTYDGGVFPPMEHFLTHLRDKTWRRRTVALVENGSWAPAACKVMRGYLEGMREITICPTTHTIQGAVKEADKKALEQIAGEILAQ